MRLGIRGKQIAGVTAIVGVAVLVLSTLYVTRLSRVVLHESDSRAQLLTSAILARAPTLMRPSGPIAACTPSCNRVCTVKV
jgi:hypothetical protein